MQILSEHSQRAFGELIERDYQAAAWLARWLALVPEYIDWQREREAKGWKFVTAEADRSISVETPSGRKLLLRGRIDRVDHDSHGHCAVIDYKARPRDALSKALEPAGEDVQLPVYALLWGGDIAAALFLSIDRDGVVEVGEASDINVLAAATRARLAALYDAIADGSELAAQGTEDVCRYCDFAGLCRKKYWCN